MSSIELFGFQAGPDGFVRHGMDPWKDYLYLLAHGGRGSGKSRAGSYRALAYVAAWPKSLGIITAPTINIIHSSTLPSLMSVFEEAGLRQGVDFDYSARREEITILVGGGTILLRSTDEPEHLRGMDAAWFWMDEPRDSPYAAFTNLVATIRQQGFPHQGWLTTTPAGKAHWLHEVFYDPSRVDGKPLGTEGQYIHFKAHTKDNPHGGPALYQQMVQLHGENSLWVRQEGGGEFVLMEGLVYMTWRPEYHVVPPAEWPVRIPDRVVAGVDFGFVNPTAVVVEGLDKEGRRYILDEVYRPGLAEQELVDIARGLQARYNVRYFACDTEDPRWIKALKLAGLPAINAKKTLRGTARNPSSGLGLCSAALGKRHPAADADHWDAPEHRMFYVDPACKNFIAEIENYVFEDPTRNRDPREAPRKHGDHLMDAWRYSEELIYKLWDHGVGGQLKVLKTTLR